MTASSILARATETRKPCNASPSHSLQSNKDGVGGIVPTNGQSFGAGQRLLSLRQVVAMTGCCGATIRQAANRGDLRVSCLPSGHRRFSEADVKRWVGVVDGSEGQDGRSSRPLIIGVIRVSTEKEEQKTSFLRQREEIEGFALSNYGRKVDVWNERKASGLLLSHPKFLELVNGIVSGEYKGGVIIATYADRICRQGRELVECLCKQNGVELRYVHKEAPKDFSEQITEDILAYMTAVCNRNSGMKAKAVLECQVSPDCLKTAFLLKKAGYSDRYIAEEIYKAGFRDEKNGKRLHHCVLAKRVKANWTALVELYGSEASAEKTSFHAFIEEMTRKTKETVGVTSGQLNKRYSEFCKENGMEAITSQAVGRIMKEELGYKRIDNKDHLMEYRGIVLVA